MIMFQLMTPIFTSSAAGRVVSLECTPGDSNHGRRESVFSLRVKLHELAADSQRRQNEHAGG